MESTDLYQVKNGFVNLKTGQFYENPDQNLEENENLIEWKGIDYETTFIDNYVSQLVSQEDKQKLQKILGCFISNNKEMIFLQIYGNGLNGKSTFINLFKQILGDRHTNIDSSILTTNTSFNFNINEKMRVLTTEVYNSNKIKIGRIKELLSGDKIITKQVIYKPIQEQINNISKVIIETRTPLVPEDNGFNRRSRSIKFTSKFNIDPTFKTELCNKLDEFLVWLVNGSIMYYNDKTL